MPSLTHRFFVVVLLGLNGFGATYADDALERQQLVEEIQRAVRSEIEWQKTLEREPAAVRRQTSKGDVLCGRLTGTDTYICVTESKTMDCVLVVAPEGTKTHCNYVLPPNDEPFCTFAASKAQ